MAPLHRFVAPWFRRGIAIVSLALLVVIVGQAPNDAPIPTTPPETADVSQAALASFKGQPGIAMYAGGCGVVCGESTVSTSFTPAGSTSRNTSTSRRPPS
jgi:hypothetical protein